MGGARSTYGGEKRWGNERERNHLEDPGVGGRTTLIWVFKKWVWGAWAGLIWLRIGAFDGLL
jgi:hypothetical protein